MKNSKPYPIVESQESYVFESAEVRYAVTPRFLPKDMPYTPLKTTERARSIKEKSTLGELLSDRLTMISLIHSGVPYPLFDTIQNHTPFTEDDWADFLNLSKKSLHRYKQSSKNFKTLQSEKIIELAEVTKAGLEVFGEMEKFKDWLNTPNYALGNVKPFELLRDSYGKDMVMGELTRINHGILV